MQNNNPPLQQGAPAAPQAPQNSNTRFYENLRTVPQEAKKPIQDGRLRGKTDVNPMWRIKRMTEVFGPCSIGWKYVITRQWLEQSDPNTVAAFCNVDLYIKDPATGQWGEPIPGTGGNVFKRRESSGSTYTDDDCFKKALTDALSIAMKALGVAADVFYELDVSKYDNPTYGASSAPATQQQPTVRNRPDSSKQVLGPNSPYWNQSIVIAMQATEPVDKIRERIEKKFTISDTDFHHLMQCAGKVTA